MGPLLYTQTQTCITESLTAQPESPYIATLLFACSHLRVIICIQKLAPEVAVFM